MKKIILLILILLNLKSFSQNYKAGDTIYFKKRLVTSKNNADFYAILKGKAFVRKKLLYKMDGYKLDKDSTSFYKYDTYYCIDPTAISSSNFKHTYYYKNGKKSSEGYKQNNRIYGKWSYWYKDGKKMAERLFHKHKALAKKRIEPEMISYWNCDGIKTIDNGTGSYIFKKDSVVIRGTYKDRKKHGTFVCFHNNVKKYEETYKRGKLKKGLSWDNKGKKYSYKQTLVNPRYPGGEKAMRRHIAENFIIPKYAYENDISGKIIVSFKIKENGVISDVNVVKKVCPPCDREAIRVVKRMKRWKPGYSRGKKVRVNYLIPIQFNL